MADDKWEWWAGLNEEFYTIGPFDEKAHAINDGIVEFESEPFYVTCATRPPFSLDARALIEAQYYERDELFDYDHSEPGRQGSVADNDDADNALQVALDQWVHDYGHTYVQPTLFGKVKETTFIEPTNVPPDAQ